MAFSHVIFWIQLTRISSSEVAKIVIFVVSQVMGLFLSLVALVCVCAVLMLYSAMRRPSNYPPGPIRFPLIGSLWYFLTNGSKPPQEIYAKFTQEYGKIFSLKIGQMDAVVLSDPKDIKQVLSKDESAGRYRPVFLDHIYFQSNIGLVSSTGQPWKEQRRFCLKTLRDFGFGKSSMEGLVKDEMRELVNDLRREGGDKPVVTKLDERIPAAVLNALWMIIASKRFDLHDEQLKKNIESFQLDFDLAAVLSFIPSVMNLLPDWANGLVKTKRGRDTLINYMQGVIEEHKQTFDPTCPRDFIDRFMLEQEVMEQQGISGHSFTDMNLPLILTDLFGAGAETTSTTLRWFILYMISYPDVQTRIQEEISKVVGRDRTPAWDDHNEMHYTQAAIHEVWRIVSLVPLGIDHCLHADMWVGKYLIPKGTVIQSNLYYAHNDPEYWQHPESFEPERFIDDKGAFVRNEALMPFQIGKRQCLGETLARMTTFLGAATLLQAFTFEKVPGESYSLEVRPKSNFINQPRPFRVLVNPRSGD